MIRQIWMVRQLLDGPSTAGWMVHRLLDGWSIDFWMIRWCLRMKMLTRHVEGRRNLSSPDDPSPIHYCHPVGGQACRCRRVAKATDAAKGWGKTVMRGVPGESPGNQSVVGVKTVRGTALVITAVVK